MRLFDPRPPVVAAVALAGMPADAARFVAALRLWLDGPDRRAEVWSAFAIRLGAAGGRAALKAFEDYLGAVADGAVRPIARRRHGDPWATADEAALAATLQPPHRAPGFIRRADRAAVAAAADRLARVFGADAADTDDLAELGGGFLRRLGLGAG
jgi:hypothetical protein